LVFGGWDLNYFDPRWELVGCQVNPLKSFCSSFEIAPSSSNFTSFEVKVVSMFSIESEEET